jgi:class 3 adenylate cyclase
MDATGILIAAVLALVGAVAGYVVARRATSREEVRGTPQRLEESDFYPFVVNDVGHVEFSADRFSEAVEYLLRERNERAARELIVIGEQNLVRDTFPTDRLDRYKRLFASYDGDAVIDENDVFLENYRRLVNNIGRSFPHTGIEILLHNLVNPSRSLVAIENGEVTGRSIGSGATNLVLDLKTRRQRGEDKVNYELNIGSRQFKCTTVPIFRPDYGLVGAICINIDTRFLREYVRADPGRLDAWIDNLLRTDFQLDEMILSKDEFVNAEAGKRHFLDEAIRRQVPVRERRLAAIVFSDIVGFTALMGDDEAATLGIMGTNDDLHARALSTHGGRILKRLGDGILASFDSVSAAVAAAMDIRDAVAADGRFEVRIGIHLGEVIESDGDVHGDGVNITSRILGAIEPGDIGITRAVFDNVKNKAGISATRLGERDLKNVDHPVELFILDR